MNKVIAIIPCAGFGTRMQMNPNQSKELLIDTKTGQPIIQWCLDLCTKYDIEPLIITRKDKQDLIDYISNKAKLIILDEVKEEWPSTVLASQDGWSDRNILILPDTRFEPEDVLKKIKDSKAHFSFGLHNVEDITKWGAVTILDETTFRFCEKPLQSDTPTAWGLIGFNKQYGESIFKLMKDRHKWSYSYGLTVESFNLTSFKDITRTGKIEY